MHKISESREVHCPTRSMEACLYSTVVDSETLPVGDARHIGDPIKARLIVELLAEAPPRCLRLRTNSICWKTQQVRALISQVKQKKRADGTDTCNGIAVELLLQELTLGLALEAVTDDRFRNCRFHVLRQIQELEPAPGAREAASAESHTERCRGMFTSHDAHIIID